MYAQGSVTVHWLVRDAIRSELITAVHAERVLTAEDWAEINAAFRENDNPLFGIKPKEEAEALYQRILALAPAPIGFGGPA